MWIQVAKWLLNLKNAAIAVLVVGVAVLSVRLWVAQKVEEGLRKDIAILEAEKREAQAMAAEAEAKASVYRAQFNGLYDMIQTNPAPSDPEAFRVWMLKMGRKIERGR